MFLRQPVDSLGIDRTLMVGNGNAGSRIEGTPDALAHLWRHDRLVPPRGVCVSVLGDLERASASGHEKKRHGLGRRPCLSFESCKSPSGDGLGSKEGAPGGMTTP